ncbi:MAG: ribosome assembly cofactor RimP [Prolixibacteraceae bacterium]|nr:ribosome assembly cofactor RimP [Prolixibacteraceae bacterium]
MIDKKKIERLAEEKLDENLFLVDVSVSPGNVIRVEIDSYLGLTIEQCVEVSRHIEGSLDRDKEDFELQVSSPGADKPFKVREQYRKNEGREVEVTLNGGDVLKGQLTESGYDGISLLVTSTEKVGGDGKKRQVTTSHAISYKDIKKAKVIISFI